MGGSRIDAGEEDEWVEMIASLVYYGVRTKGLSIDLLSPINEPDWDGNEGPQVGSEQYVRLLHKLATRLDALGLGAVKFVGPDTADASAAAAFYYPAMARDALVMAHTEAIGIHNYSGAVGGIGGVIANSVFKFDALLGHRVLDLVRRLRQRSAEPRRLGLCPRQRRAAARAS